MNVFFIEVYVVRWNNETCAAKLDGDEFPSTTIFDINAETNKPAFSFYSRHHIVNTKMPEIEDAIDGEVDKVLQVESSIEDGETKVCCDKGDLKGFCLPTEGTLRLCTQDDLDQAIFNAGELIQALVHWQSILNNADVAKMRAISDSSYGNILNWFEKQELYQYIESTDFTEDEKKHIRMDKSITDYSQLAPESLTDMMNPFPDRSDPFVDPLTSSEESKTANRIQFSGNSGSYTLTLDRSSSSKMTTMTCSGSGLMKAMSIWQKIINYDPLSDGIPGLTDGIPGWTGIGLVPITQFGVKAFKERIKRFKISERIKKLKVERKVGLLKAFQLT